MWPLVSIIIPVYNGANYVAEAIESALSQTYPNVEIIVVNDGSNDNGATELAIEKYKNRVRYFVKENGGVSSALNLGIKNMQGMYFSWLSHDDLYTPDKVEKQMEMLSQWDFPDDKLVLCADRQIDKDGKLYERSGNSMMQAARVIEWREALEVLFRMGSFNGCALLIPRRAFQDCGLFHEGLRYCQDFLMWVEIFLHQFSLLYNEDVCVYNRVHGAQVTQTRKDLFHKDSSELGEIILDRVAAASDADRNLLYHYAVSSAKSYNRKIVKKCVEVGNERRLFSKVQRLKIRAVLTCGRVRPWIRKIYYKIFRHIDVQ